MAGNQRKAEHKCSFGEPLYFFNPGLVLMQGARSVRPAQIEEEISSRVRICVLCEWRPSTFPTATCFPVAGETTSTSRLYGAPFWGLV